MKEFKYNNVLIKLGTNQLENHTLLTLRLLHPDWIWLHAKNCSSGHAIICCADPSLDFIEFAAIQVKKGCKEKNNPNCKIEYTKLGNLELIPKTIGQVLVNSSKKITV